MPTRAVGCCQYADIQELFILFIASTNMMFFYYLKNSSCLCFGKILQRNQYFVINIKNNRTFNKQQCINLVLLSCCRNLKNKLIDCNTVSCGREIYNPNANGNSKSCSSY